MRIFQSQAAISSLIYEIFTTSFIIQLPQKLYKHGLCRYVFFGVSYKQCKSKTQIKWKGLTPKLSLSGIGGEEKNSQCPSQ